MTPVSGPDWEDKGWKNDGMGVGDYPNLPEHSQQLRNPYLTYWDQQDRRNFGEPVSDILHIEIESIFESTFCIFVYIGNLLGFPKKSQDFLITATLLFIFIKISKNMSSNPDFLQIILILYFSQVYAS